MNAHHGPRDVTDGEQLFLFEMGLVQRQPPEPEELERALTEAVKMAIYKRHRGRPPNTVKTWEDLKQEVAMRAYHRLRNFRHGGRKTLTEYSYVAACYALTDIHRENMWRNDNIQPQSYPLLEA
jgi:hypothetical protein